MIKKFFTFTLVLLLLIFNTSLLNAKKDDEILKTINNMTLEEKIGQLFIIRLEALDASYTTDKECGKKIIHTSLTEEMKQTYSSYPCGGIILFTRNIENEKQLKELTSSIHDLNSITPLVSIDEEGGSVSRIANNPNFDVIKYSSAKDIGDAGDVNKAYELGYMIGSYLNDYGIDLDFAPVADVNSNPNNKVIGDRSFSSNCFTVAKNVAMCIAGFHDVGILTCIKHFPGHGDTSSDSHLGSVYTYKTWDELKENEIMPFEYGIASNTDMIMVGHISTPNITGNNEPASLSYELITNKLRNELNYNGVIITDSFEMGAIMNNCNTKEAIIKTINAGVDIILMPENYIEAFNALKEAIENNEITIDRIDESLYRILSLKNAKFSLFEYDDSITSKDLLITSNDDEFKSDD